MTPSPSGNGHVEHLDVLVIGAGLSGVGAAHYLRTECPWASWAILEARGAIGGTWDLFRYPGVRSDSDMYTLGYPFRPWDDDRAIVDGASIREYIEATAAEEGIADEIRFHHRVVAADWSTEDARWHVTAERTDRAGGAPETVELTCGFIFSCTGYYRYDHGYQPDFPGIDDFAGAVVHPQAWPEDLDYEGKRIVVIGSGATAVTLVTSMAETAAHVTMLQRSPTYITSLPTKDPLANLARQWLPKRWSGGFVRWYKALTTQALYRVSKLRPQLVKRALRKGAARQLPAGYPVDVHFSPRYDPWDQRLCLIPDGDLFRAISEGSVSVVTDTIDRFTPTGIRLSSGDELPADVVVTATGLEMLFLGGIDLRVDGAAVDVGKLLAFRGMMLSGVPNLAMAIGYTNASWTLRVDLTCRYVVRLLDTMRRSGMRQCTPINDDPDQETRPVLDLSSGYIRRAADHFPKQGSRYPWQTYQSYWRDYRALRRHGIDDDALRFSNPAPASPAAEPLASTPA